MFRSQNRNQTVHLSIDREMFHHFTAISFQTIVDIVKGNTCKKTNSEIEQFRGISFDKAILAILFPAGNYINTFILKCHYQTGYGFRVILQICIYGNDILSIGKPESFTECRCLSAISPKQTTVMRLSFSASCLSISVEPS